ncbi:MAG: adenylosuccinate lyase [Spirochaetales bacterium]|nr:adenylosuccinate lyase [Spirochaetales bacterium]
METKNIFTNLSPLDHRYYLANRELFDDLARYLSEDASIKYCIKAEAALLKSHLSIMEDGDENHPDVVALETRVTSEAVYQEEEKTQHNIRALVNVIKTKLPDDIKPLVHLGATSVDVLDTAASMRNRDVTRNVIIPLMLEVEELLISLARDNAATPQVGRTHGQHAVPITLGYAFAEYVSRFGKSIKELERLSGDLRGKLAGAVGAYNATSLIVSDPEELEKKYLDYLGLKPSDHSTQMVEPEYLLRLLLEMNTAFGVIANLADDLRHLQRSEINELREMFTSTQVGSSTMPQKRNPWNSEHVKSLWKAFAPRVMTFYMDQISEHQRDLSNSASARFVTDYITGFAAALNRMKKVLSTIHVEEEIIRKNITYTGDLVLAEAAYILISVCGEPDGHEKIRLATLECEKNSTSLAEELHKDDKIWKNLNDQLGKTIGVTAEAFFKNPELYRGLAVERTNKLVDEYGKLVDEIKEAL